ncbi:MAG: hypothetical protein WAZ18_01430 [Alphaproteobacteria bacterium]
MTYRIATSTTPAWRTWLMGLLGMALAGCTAQPCCGPTVQYAYAEPAPADAALQACANHAAAGIRAGGQPDFKYLKLDAADRFVSPFNRYVGNTYVATVQDAYGQWYGRTQWAKVRVHCLSDAQGQVVYSFVRGE